MKLYADEIFSKDVLNWSKVKSKDKRFLFQINAVFLNFIKESC